MRITLLLAALLALVLAGCGGSSNKNAGSSSNGGSAATPAGPSAQASGGTLKLSSPADGSTKFDQASATAKAGKLKIEFSNPSPVPHAVAVEGQGIDKKGKTITGGSDSLSVDLKPGTYTFYCPVDGHRAAGMEGKLTVQ